jgi:predicted amidophosphoribosyltransferase
MARKENDSVTVACPCCGANLTIDPALEKVIAHEAPPERRHAAPDLDHAAALLREQAARREAIFKQSAEDEKDKPQLLERKFAEALKKSKDQPIVKPTRDIDLD